MKNIVTLLSFSISLHVFSQNPLLIKQVNGTNLTPGESGTTRFYKHQLWNNKVFYTCNGVNNICVTDGTNAGTVNIYNLTPPPGAQATSISYLGPAQDFMYFRYRAQFPVSGGVIPITEQIWKTNGTTAGTELVYSYWGDATTPLFFSNQSSDPSRPAGGIVGNTLFFSMVTAGEGRELWKTDGTAAGTFLVKDIRPGTNSSGPVNFGTIGNKVLFYAVDGVVGAELWGTDGTPTGTQLVKDINPDNSSGGASISSGSNFLQGETGVCNGKYFFYANVIGTYGAEPWVSDGTEAGTFLLKDIAPGTASSNVTVSQSLNDFFATGKYMFFRAKNLSTTSQTGAALWRSDGTEAGTIFLSAADSLSSTAAVAVTGGDKYFMLFNNNQGGTSSRQFALLTDGTNAGTKIVDTAIYAAGTPAVYKNAAYFTAQRNVSTSTLLFDLEVWRTDGLKANTGVALDVYTGVQIAPPFTIYNSGNPQKYFVLNNFLHFFGKNAASPFWGLFRYSGDFTFNGLVAGSNWRDSANWDSMIPPGITDTAYVNAGATPNVNGRNAYAGTLIMQNGSSINLNASIDSLFINKSIQADTLTGNGILVLKNFGSDTVKINNGFTTANLAVQSNTSITAGTVNVTNHLNVSNGNLLTNNNPVIVGNGSGSRTIGKK